MLGLARNPRFLKAVRGSGYLLAGRRWIAEAHDGEIHVVSEVGVGTRVTLDLPVT